jgi:hypothetical protein
VGGGRQRHADERGKFIKEKTSVFTLSRDPLLALKSEIRYCTLVYAVLPESRKASGRDPALPFLAEPN